MSNNIPTSLWIGYDANGRVPPMQLQTTGYCSQTGLPTPRHDEREHQYFSRCMGNHAMMQKFPGYKARANHALRRWREHGEAVKMAASQQGQPVRNQATQQEAPAAVQHAKNAKDQKPSAGTSTETGGSSPGGASTGGVGSGIGGAGTGGAATGGASTGGAGTVTVTISGSSGSGNGGKKGAKGGGGEKPITLNISNVGGGTGSGKVQSGDGPGSSGQGGKGEGSGGGGGGAAPSEPADYKAKAQDKPIQNARQDTMTAPPKRRAAYGTQETQLPKGEFGQGDWRPRKPVQAGDRQVSDEAILALPQRRRTMVAESPVKNAAGATISAPASRRAEFGTQLPRKPREDVGRVYQPRGSAVQTAAANDEKNYYRGLHGQTKPVQQSREAPSSIEELDDLIGMEDDAMLQGPVQEQRRDVRDEIQARGNQSFPHNGPQGREALRDTESQSMGWDTDPELDLDEPVQESRYDHASLPQRPAASKPRIVGGGYAEQLPPHGDFEEERVKPRPTPRLTEDFDVVERNARPLPPDSRFNQAVENFQQATGRAGEPAPKPTQQPSSQRQGIRPQQTGFKQPVRKSATLGVKYPDKDTQLAGERVTGMQRDYLAGRPVVPREPPQTESDRSDQRLLDSQSSKIAGRQAAKRPERNAARKNLSTEPGAIRPAKGNVLRPLKVREPRPPKSPRPQNGPAAPTAQQAANASAGFQPASAEGAPPAPAPSPNPSRRPATEGADRSSNQIARDQWSKENNRPTLASSVATGLATTPASKTAFLTALGNAPQKTTQRTPGAGEAKRHEGLKNFVANPANKEHVANTVNSLRESNQSTVGPDTFSDMVLDDSLKHARNENQYEGRAWKEGDVVSRPFESFRDRTPLTDTRTYQPIPPKEQPKQPLHPERNSATEAAISRDLYGHKPARRDPFNQDPYEMDFEDSGFNRPRPKQPVQNAARIGGHGATPTEFNAGPAPQGQRRAADMRNLRQGYGNAIAQAVDAEEAAAAAAPKPQAANPTKVKQPTEVDWASATAAGPKPKEPSLVRKIGQGFDRGTEAIGQFLGAPGSETGKHNMGEGFAKKLGFQRAPTSNLGKAMYARAEQLMRQGASQQTAFAASGLAGVSRNR